MKTSEILERAELSEKYEVNITDEQRKRLVPQGRIPQQVAISGKNAIESPWSVSARSMKSVTVFNPGATSPRFSGKKYKFLWDGTGYKRQGQYLIILKDKVEEFEEEMDAYLESPYLFDDEECCPRAAVEKAVAKWKAQREGSKS